MRIAKIGVFAIVSMWLFTSAMASDVGKEASDSQVACLTSTTVIDTGDAKRLSFVVQSEDTTNPVWVCFAATCATNQGGVKLAPGTTNGLSQVSTSFPFEYTGALSCIATGSTVTVNYSELLVIR